MKKSEATRRDILQKAFELIYARGYQNTSLDDILATTKVTKGAFYYHFKNKEEMGIAIIEEVMRPGMVQSFIAPLRQEGNPLDKIYQMVENLLLNERFLVFEYGCPTSNMVQEVSPWNTTMGKALKELVDQCQQELITTIQQGIDDGLIRPTVVPVQVAFFTMSGYWGIRNFAKAYGSPDCYAIYLQELKYYLNSLR